jgi:hypothetical protein
MTVRTAGLALFCAALVAALPAAAQQKRRGPAPDAQQAEIERLNEESLQRARQGQNSPTPGPDTASNLNRMSEGAARQGRNMDRAPMPFR